MANKLEIISLNCRGLANRIKRKDLFSKFKEDRLDIILLQDTHWDAQSAQKVNEEWGYEMCCLPFDTRSRGTAILLNNTFEFTIGITKTDPLGNYSLIELILPEKFTLVLGSIYAPNQDSPEFIQNLGSLLEEFENPNILVGGDWNSTRNFQLDNLNYVNQNNLRMTLAISEFFFFLQGKYCSL